MKRDDKIPLVEFHAAGVAELDLYQKREKIYTRRIEGFYQRIRAYTGWALLLGYFLLPWLQWGNRQAVLFDLPIRQFFFFDITFWPQDFPLLTGLLIIAAFALFTITAWAGRLWCGYSCPQTVWTAIYMWSEQLCEGSRNQRIKRDRGPWSLDKIRRKISKHSMWLSFAFLTGFTFVGYFSPIRDLSVDFYKLTLGSWEFFWISFFTVATYINAGWLCEQVCIYMCPYARFQAVMFDNDTLLVTYDHNRGESRGARKKDADPKDLELGDCVDCQICVQVCPTGIDIREGMQFECINCALCIDGCNSVMEQMGYEKGLIRYATENSMKGIPTQYFRPRLVAYAVALLLMMAVFVAAVVSRVPVYLDVARDRDRLYHVTDVGLIENTYTLKVTNMTQHAHRYQLSVTGVDDIEVLGDKLVYLQAGELIEIPLRLRSATTMLRTMISTIYFHIQLLDGKGQRISTESRFIGPELSYKQTGTNAKELL